MKKITIEIIPHERQRYETVGDWIVRGDELKIFVSDMKNWKYNMLVAEHELDEALLCIDRGITQKQVDDFDKDFEKKREKGNTDEPGDDPNAPYGKEHFFATTLERLRCAEFGLNWKKYNDTVNSL